MGFRDRAIEAKQAKQDEKDERNERDENPETVWEYKAVNLAKIVGTLIEGKFNELGQRGFEFQAMSTGGSEGYAIFKRRLAPA
jgi:hypothetical protein